MKEITNFTASEIDPITVKKLNIASVQFPFALSLNCLKKQSCKFLMIPYDHDD